MSDDAILLVVRAKTCDGALALALEHDIPARLYGVKADAIWLIADASYRRETLFWANEHDTNLVFAS